MNKKILMTGGAGFVGRHLADELILRNYEVHFIIRNYSNNVYKDSELRIHHEYDGTYNCLYKIMKNVKPEIVVHLASVFLAEHESSDIEKLFNSNLLFPTMLAEAMAKCGVQRLINTGTSWQYYESDIFKPVNLYASTKEAYESILEYYKSRFNWNIISLYLFDTYGPNDERNKIINLLLKNSESKSILLMSEGLQNIDLVHVYDVCRAFVIAIELLECPPQGFHKKYGVSSSRPVNLRDLVALCENAWQVELIVEWGAREYREREVMNPWSTYCNLPGWSPQIDLTQGLKNLKYEKLV
jgi:nucleoside-diphosphate-sugar epimerase